MIRYFFKNKSQLAREEWNFLFKVYKTSISLVGFMSEFQIWLLVWSLRSSNLLDHDINFVTVFHVEFLGSLGFMKSLTIKEEPDIVDTELK
jgi:hypothetical protein